MTDQPGSFPDSAAEMANETEVEEEPVAALPAEEVGEGGDEADLVRIELAERTLDLQRVQAEYLNYKRRVDRDRELIKQNATYAALAPITEVMDTVDRAREHGEVGDPFDPTIHEALSHIGEDPEVQVTTCKVVAKAGYRIGDRVVRAAQVLVVDPATGPMEDVGGGTIDASADTSIDSNDEE